MEKLITQATTAELFQELERRKQVETTKDILLAISKLSVLALATLLAPNGAGAIYRAIYKDHKDENYKKAKIKIRATIHKLRQQELLNIQEDDNGNVILTLTDAGKKRVLRYNLDQLKIQRPKIWDGYWRIIVFDIPESSRGARDALRDKMKELGFYQLQKSVWVYPFLCKDEIDFVANFFNIGRYLLYLEVKHLENESFLRHFFRL